MELTAAQIAMASLAMTTASAVSTYVASNAQADAAQRQADAANKSAWDNYYSQTNQLQEQSNQITQSSQNELNERERMRMIDEGKIRTTSGESGVAGLSVDRLLNDADFQASMDIGSIESNRNNKLKQTEAEKTSAWYGAVNKSNQAQSSANQANAQRKTALGTGLQIAGSAVSAGKDTGWFKS
jgi:hypothetical protein